MPTNTFERRIEITDPDALVKEFADRVNPYTPSKCAYRMDYRAYAKYVKENGLTGKDITPEIMEMFIVK